MDTEQNTAFTDMLREHREGWSLNELGVALQTLVTEVRQTGKGGDLVYKLKIKPASKGAGNAVVVLDEIIVNPPKLERESGIFFSTEKGALQRQNPNQRELELKVIKDSVKDAPLKEVKSAGA